MRDAFHIPGSSTAPHVYLCGHSLGAMPVAARDEMLQGLEAWEQLAVDGHFEGNKPWFYLGESLRAPMGRIVGAHEQDVVLTGTLTNNLHLLLRSFYRPDGKRSKLLIEHSAFPSDLFCARSHVASRGLNPDEHVLCIQGGGAAGVPTTDEILSAIETHADEIATVLLPGVSYITGAVYDIAAITDAAHRAGALVGWDLAHAVGNIPLTLDNDHVDFAAWCTYKYLNGGPGAVGGLFVHPKHTRDTTTAIPRYEGWWGNDAATRFTPNQIFSPAPGAAAWQLSNVPVFSLLPLYASLAIFDEVGMADVWASSCILHGALRDALSDACPNLRILTPSRAHGAQLSLQIDGRAAQTQQSLQHRGIICDTRGDDILRVAAVPLYNTLEDVAAFVTALAATLKD